MLHPAANKNKRAYYKTIKNHGKISATVCVSAFRSAHVRKKKSQVAFGSRSRFRSRGNMSPTPKKGNKEKRCGRAAAAAATAARNNDNISPKQRQRFALDCVNCFSRFSPIICALFRAPLPADLFMSKERSAPEQRAGGWHEREPTVERESEKGGEECANCCFESNKSAGNGG